MNALVVRGLLRYQLNRSWYLISSPIIASDWTKPEGKGWIVPVGGGLGYSFRLGGQPMQVSLEGAALNAMHVVVVLFVTPLSPFDLLINGRQVNKSTVSSLRGMQFVDHDDTF